MKQMNCVIVAFSRQPNNEWLAYAL